MADLAIAPIVIAGVAIQKALHRLGQWRAADFEQKMKVIGHQNVGVQRQRMVLDHFAEQRLESTMVLIVFINALPLITPADDVKEGTGKVYSRSSRHQSHLAQDDSNKQIIKA